MRYSDITRNSVNTWIGTPMGESSSSFIILGLVVVVVLVVGRFFKPQMTQISQMQPKETADDEEEDCACLEPTELRFTPLCDKVLV